MSTDLVVLSPSNNGANSTFMGSANSPLKSNRRQKGNKNSNNDKQYDLEFPSGSMGLELEPVIVSSAKRVGSRVKHFHYDYDYNGHDPTYLESNVIVGDIISKINGEVVVAWTFEDILMKLRALKNEKKTITFKNVTATWTTSKARSDAPITPNKTPRKSDASDVVTPVNGRSNKNASFAEECITQSPIVSKMLNGTTPIKNQENTVNGSTNMFSLKDPQKLPGEVSPVRSALSPKVGGNSSSSKNRGLSVSPLAVKELVAATTGKTRGSASPLVNVSAPPLQPKRSNDIGTGMPGQGLKPGFTIYVESPTAEQQRLEEERFQRQQQQHAAVVAVGSAQSVEFSSPKASSFRNLAAATTPSPSGSGWKTLRQTPPSQKKSSKIELSPVAEPLEVSSAIHEGVESNEASEEHEEDSLGEAVVPFNRIMGRVGETLGNGLYNVEAALLGSALTVTNVLTQRAETALKNTSEYIPVYNNHEMKSVVNKKHDLLKELSQSYFLLGQVEASQDQRTKQLQSTLDQIQLDNDRLALRVKTLEAEVSVLKTESEMDGTQVQTLQQTIQQLTEEKAEMMLQMQESLINLQDLETVLEVTQRTLEHERGLHIDQIGDMQASIDAMTKEQAMLRQELTAAFESATARLASSEAEHSESEQKLQEELSRLQELEVVLKQENQKLKESNVLQQDWHRERLAEKVAEAQQLQSELMSVNAGLQTMTNLHKEGEEAKCTLQSQLSVLQSELSTVRGSNLKYKEQLTNSTQKLEAKVLELKALQEKVDQQTSEIETVTAEKEVEVERCQVLNLQFGALQAELNSTRQEMDCLNDTIKSHNIDVLQLQLKNNNTLEEVARLEAELKVSREECDGVRNELVSAANRYAEASAVIQKKEVETSEKDASIAELQEQTTSLYGLVDLIQKQKDDLASEVDQWKKQCAALTEDCVSVSAERDQLKGVESRLMEELSSCNEALEQLRKENELLCEENKTMMSDSESKYQFLDQRISALISEKEDLVSSHAVVLQKTNGALLEATTKVTQLEQLLSNLTSEKASMVVATATEKAEATRKHELELELLQKQLLQLNAQNAQLLTLHTGTAQEKDKLIASLQQQVQRYQLEAEKSVVEKTRLMEEMERLTREKTVELSALMSVCKTHEEDISRMLTEREEYLQAAAAAALLKEKEFMSALSLAEDMQDSLRGDLHAKLQESQAQLEVVKTTLSQTQQTLIETEAQLVDSRKISQSLNDLHAALVTEHQTCLDSHKTEIAAMQKKLQTQSTELMTHSSTLNAGVTQLQEKDATIASLKETLKSGHEMYTKALNENKSHLKEISVQSARISALQQEIAEKDSFMEMGKKAIALQKSKLAEEAEANSKLAVECKQLMDQKIQLESSLASLKSFGSNKVGSLLQELTALKEQLAVLKDEVLELQLTHESAMSSVAAKDTGSQSTITALQYDLQSVEKKLTASLSENIELLQKLSAADQLNVSCEKHIAAQEEKIQTLEKAIVTMKEIHVSGVNMIEVEHQGQVTKLEESIKDLVAKLASTENQSNAAREEKVELASEVSSLKSRLSEVNASVESLTKCNDDLTLKMGSADSLNASLQQKITFLEETYQSVQKNSTSELTHLQTKLQDLFKEKSELELKNIRQEQERAMAQSQFTQQLMVAKQEQEDLLKTALSQHRQALAVMQKEQDDVLEGCRQDRATLIASYEAQLLQVTSAHNETVRILREETLNESNRLKLAQMNQINDMRSDMEAMMNERNNSIKTLSEELLSLHDKYRNEADAMVRKHTATVEELHLFIKSLKEDASKAFVLLNQREDTIKNLQQKSAKADDDLSGVALELTEKESKIRQLTQEQLDLNTTLSVLQDELHKSESELKQLRSQCALYQSEASVARQQEEELKQQVAVTHSELNDFMEEKKHQLSLLNKEIQLLKSNLAISQQAVLEMEEKFNNSQEDLMKCAADLKDSYARERSYADDVTDLEARVTDLQDQLLAREDALTLQRSEVFQALEKTVRLEEELVIAREQVKIQELMQDKSSKTLQSEVTEAQMQIHRLKADNNQYKAKLQDLYSTVITQQQVLTDAENRESEHKSHVTKLETLVTKYEERYREALADLMTLEKSHSEGSKRHDQQTKGLLDELAHSQTKILSLERELNYKRSEIDNLLQHVQMLVDATVSPVKSGLSAKPNGGPTTRMRESRTASAAPAVAEVAPKSTRDDTKHHQTHLKDALINPLRDITGMLSNDESDQDKENCSQSSSAVDILSGRQLGGDRNAFTVFTSPDRGSPASSKVVAAADVPDGEVELWKHNKWQDSLMVISLEMHEIITFVLLEVNTASGGLGEMKCLLTLLSKKHNSLHEMIVRPPWWMESENSVSTLTPAHDRLFTVQMKGSTGCCSLPKDQIIRNLLQCSDASPQRSRSLVSNESQAPTSTDGIAYHASGNDSEKSSRSVFSLGDEFDLKLEACSSSNSSRVYSLSSAILEECDNVLRNSMEGGSDDSSTKNRSVRFSLEKGYNLPQAFPTSISHRGSGIEDAARLISNECDVSMDSLNSTTDLNVSSDSEVGLDHETTFEEEDSLFVVLDENK